MDLVTTSFQAVAGVAVVFTAGYAINPKQDAKFASVSSTHFPPLENRSRAERFGCSSKCATSGTLIHHAIDHFNDMAEPLDAHVTPGRDACRLISRMADSGTSFDDTCGFFGICPSLFEVEQGLVMDR